MPTAEKFGGNALAKHAIPIPGRLKDKWGTFLLLRLGGHVLVWCMDRPALARPPSAAGREVERCDFAVFQADDSAANVTRRLFLVEIKASIGGDTADKVRGQLEGGLSVLRELAEPGKFSFDSLAPILVHGASLGKADAFALGRIQITPAPNWDPVPIRWCKSGSTLTDGNVIVHVAD